MCMKKKKVVLISIIDREQHNKEAISVYYCINNIHFELLSQGRCKMDGVTRNDLSQELV